MWWPLRRRERGRHAAGRVVFIGASGPIEPWAPSDLAVLQQAAAVLDTTPLPAPVEPAAPVATPSPIAVPTAAAPPRAVAPARITAPPRASAPPPPPVPEPAPSVPPPPAVSLGFADGSSVNLHADHPAAVALRAVADRLVSAAD